ncbi:c-type lysozyme inhibitor [Proteus vulgaris]|uniref:c-type lysozyme inhibitor n=1 Tax=Proteus vulgaris TaxID=585 RepID=UPI0018E40F80|nr:c-type lysozyme inhibitor [Proteus vulgaris]MBI6544466.1 c-type lysozyme inhibitor [Proteus vulgaris]
MKLLLKSIAFTVSLLSASFVMADDGDEITKVSYACENNQIMEVIYINTAKDSYAIINQMDEMIPMKIMKMASGANYEAMNKNYTYKLYTKGDNADLVEGKDKPVLSGCKAG